MIPDYHYFTTGSAFGEIDQPPTRSALLRANWRGSIRAPLRLYLPKSSDRPIIPEAGKETASFGLTSSHEMILVVEDDEDVLTVAAESLR